VYNFLVFFTVHVILAVDYILNYDLFVESSRKMEMRQFKKWKSISDSRSAESISDKRL